MAETSKIEKSLYMISLYLNALAKMEYCKVRSDMEPETKTNILKSVHKILFYEKPKEDTPF
jgi:hypothetical protein